MMDYRKVEKLETCPYNSSHQILPHRMAKHLIKCKKNYPNSDMKVCIFNAVHVVPAHQYQAHLLNCEDRQLVEREVYSRPQIVNDSPLMKPGTMPVQNISSKSDDWEADCVQSSYSPEKYVIYKEFTRAPPPGLSKSARKQWRLNEIDRVNRLKNGMLLDDSQSDTDARLSKTSASSKNVDWSAGGAVPKLQDKNIKSSSSSAESDTNYVQVSLNRRQPCGTTSVSSAYQSTEKASLGNPIDESQISEKLNHKLDKTDFIKEKRKLEKKLSEISKLENMKVNLNQKLTYQEESKILLKEGIMEQLSNLKAGTDL